MKKQKKILFLLILIFGVLILLRFISGKPVSEAPFKGKRTVEKIIVKAASVTKRDLNLILSYVGSLKAKDEINVFSKVTGKLTQYTVNDGDSVEKGQTIALIDRDEVGLKYELAKVESPLSGIVGKTLLDKGANILTSAAVTAGTSLAIIVNMDEMIVRLNIPEIDVPYFKKGLPAQIKVDAYPEGNFVGEVSKVSEIVDTQTRTLPIEITIPNQDHRLKSGMFCRIKIIASVYKDALSIPQDALVQELGVTYVFAVEDHTAIKKKIVLGIKEDSLAQVLEGLKENESVIVFGQQGLKDGTPVEVAKD